MELIKKYFPTLTIKQINNLIQMENLYIYWNSRINLISRKTIQDIYQQHILYSLSISKVIQFSPKTYIMDVGTGGGFPGIPLAIIFPEIQFFLIDSINKKIKVIKDITEKLNLNNVFSYCIRVEQVNKKFDFILSRGVAKIPKFYSLVKNKFQFKSQNILNNGIFYLKGGDLTEELKNFPQAIEFPISNYFEEYFFITKKIVYIPIIY